MSFLVCFWSNSKRLCLLIVIFVLCVMISSCATSLITEKHSIQKIKVNEPFAVVAMQYPQFANYLVLNRAIEDSVLIPYNEFMQNAESEWSQLNEVSDNGGENSVQNVPPLEYNVQCKPVYCGDSFISVLIVAHANTGGVHGTFNITSLYYDTVANRFKNISEVTGMSEASIAVKCRKVLATKILCDTDSETEKMQQIMVGTEPDAGNFSVFTYDGRKVTIYFPPYSVLPDLFDTQEVEIIPVWE